MALRRPSSGLGRPQWEIFDIYDNPEYQYAEGLAMEFCDIAGIKAIYYPQDGTVTPDILYGETQDKAYTVGKETKIIMEIGEIPTVYSVFGMIATDQLVVHIPQGVFRRDVSGTLPPKVGDVVVLSFYRDVPTIDTPVGRTFEVLHVAEDQNIFQLRSLTYSIYMTPYRFSEESDSAAAVSSDLPTATPSITAYGDNDWLQEQSDLIDDYDDVDTSIYRID